MTSSNSKVLPIGIPLVRDYKNLLKTDLFLEMESFSNTFLENHWKTLKYYRHRWVSDPFHQWSRQWEYPFAYSYIQQHIISSSNFTHYDEIRILDAGSGCTFFPYYLVYKHPNSRVYCCDYDHSLAPIFKEINKKMNANVRFNTYNIANLGYEDNFFDIIYCISVLEHTPNYVNNIIKEFKRVLNQNGLLIVTFDIALDNKTEINWASRLLSELDNELSAINSDNSCKVLFRDIKSDILTTEFIRTFDKNLLPWKLTWASFVGQLLKLKRPKIPFRNLTIFCGVWKKDGTTIQK
jgi:ubiquinone/menaquinone biosynthesis C-methylase UbiE